MCVKSGAYADRLGDDAMVALRQLGTEFGEDFRYSSIIENSSKRNAKGCDLSCSWRKRCLHVRPRPMRCAKDSADMVLAPSM